MKSIRFILITLFVTLLLTACERPAPEGEIPPPVDNGTEIVPRTDEAYPAQPTDAAPIEATVATPTTTTEDGTGGNTDTQSTDEETNTTDTDTTTEETGGETPALEDGVYVVRSGDTLGQIAFAFGISVEDIMAANNLANPDSLDVGQALVIPDEGSAETADTSDDTTTSAEEPTPTTPNEEQIHIVQPGDNLYRIGLQYGFTIDELAQYNELTDVNNLEVGQEIRIPPSN